MTKRDEDISMDDLITDQSSRDDQTEHEDDEDSEEEAD